MRNLHAISVALLAAGALLVAACGGDDNSGNEKTSTPEAQSTQAPSGQIAKNDANSSVSLKIGSKSFTEQRILGEIFAQGLAAAGYNTSTDLNFADENAALAALKAGK